MRKLKLIMTTITILLCSIVSGISPAQSNNNSQKNNIPIDEIRHFATVINQIKQYYIQPVSDKKLFKNAIHGMLTRLDPHSAYLDEQSLKNLQITTTGKFGGIGIEIIPDKSVIKVVTPLDDSPAKDAGIKSGDFIIKINNKLTQGMGIEDAVKLIRGKPDTDIQLTVLRKGIKKPLEFEITREVIKIVSVKSKLYDKHYGYLRVAFFQNNTKANLIKAFDKIKAKSHNHLKGLVIDLRNNPGGLLDSSIDVADLFLNQKTLNHDKLIVSTKGRLSHTNTIARSKTPDITNNIPIIVLINQGSASAAEIVAGALQDHKRAVILGKQSFGKGSVQTIIPIDEKTAIKLTTALYYTPKGQSIQAKGITPDILIADLKLTEINNDIDTILMQPINEKNLKNHIKNQSDSTDKIATKSRHDNTKLAKQDYPLYQAINLLKAMNTASNIKSHT